MEVSLRPIDSIKPCDKNPRKNEAAVDAVAKSIQAYGFRQPIVVDEDVVIIVGHTRLKAAQKLGMTEVPVHVAVGLDPAKARAYRLADNATNEIAEWDYELLPLELTELKDLGIDIGTLGWSSDDLTEIFAPLGNDGLVDPDDVPAPADAAITQPGDLIILGNHRLLCVDSPSVADVDRLFDGAVIHLCNIDPPYNVRVEPRAPSLSSAARVSNSTTWRLGSRRWSSALLSPQRSSTNTPKPREPRNATTRPRLPSRSSRCLISWRTSRVLCKTIRAVGHSSLSRRRSRAADRQVIA